MVSVGFNPMLSDVLSNVSDLAYQTVRMCTERPVKRRKVAPFSTNPMQPADPKQCEPFPIIRSISQSVRLMAERTSSNIHAVWFHFANMPSGIRVQCNCLSFRQWVTRMRRSGLVVSLLCKRQILLSTFLDSKICLLNFEDYRFWVKIIYQIEQVQIERKVYLAIRKRLLVCVQNPWIRLANFGHQVDDHPCGHHHGWLIDD